LFDGKLNSEFYFTHLNIFLLIKKEIQWETYMDKTMEHAKKKK